jgi:hypothetical protein
MKLQQGKLDEFLQAMQMDFTPEGFLGSRVLVPDLGSDEILLVVFFEDRAAYLRNANDPRMHEAFTRYRALLTEDPEWNDGEWLVYDA